jgi:diguanylate cyclase (GGDEF)-like protein
MPALRDAGCVRPPQGQESSMTSDRSVTGALQLVSDVSAALAGTGDLDAGVERLLEIALDAAGATVGVAYLQDPDRVELSLGVAVGVAEDAGAAIEAALAATDDPIAATARDRTTRTVSGGEVPADLAALGLATITLRPLDVNRGGIDIPAGVLLLGWSETRELTDEDEVTITAIADFVAVAVDRARLASMIQERSEWFERMAHTDPLTGLANQRTFARILELELARAARQGSEISLAVFDVDGLGATNTALGHEAGDDVLRAVASVLAESVRLVDTVARYGGDEFVLIAPGAAGATVAKRVLDGVQSLPVAGGAPITVSAGVARFPEDGTTADELLASAMAALTSARSAGPGRIASAGVEAAGSSSS